MANRVDWPDDRADVVFTHAPINEIFRVTVFESHPFMLPVTLTQ